MGTTSFNKGIVVGRNNLAQITGAPVIGGTLTCVTFGLTSPTYQWTRDGADIASATSSIYTLTVSDSGTVVGCRVSGSANASTVGTVWTPADLGASLLGWWDAERADLVTQSGGPVSSWKDVVGAYDVTQGTGSLRPVYSATSFNGRPGITFDGADDNLALASSPFPTGAAASEIWGLVSQDTPFATAGTLRILAYGGVTNNDSRYVYRVAGASTNTAGVSTGTGAAAVFSTTGAGQDFLGLHVVRGIVTPTTAQVELDGTAGTASPAVSATGSTKTAIGAGTNGAGLFKGIFSAVLVTGSLTAGQSAQLYTYLKARGGIP